MEIQRYYNLDFTFLFDTISFGILCGIINGYLIDPSLTVM